MGLGRTAGAAANSTLRTHLHTTMTKITYALNPVLKWRPGPKDGAEVLLLALALPIYYLVRGQVTQRVSEAVDRGVGIVHFEQSLGIFWEPDLQRAVLDYHWFVDGLNYFYLFGHLPVIGALAVWLYFWHRPQYLLMRNAFLISGAIALVFYINFPTAPPRLLPDHLGFGLTDTVFDQYNTGRPYTFGGFVNEYAAFPSMPFGMFTDIILTANHYLLDPIAAVPVVGLGLAITLGGRWLVLRVLSPESKGAREHGWVSWVYWLVAIDEASVRQQQQRAPQPA